jgi:hypothetical protein
MWDSFTQVQRTPGYYNCTTVRYNSTRCTEYACESKLGCKEQRRWRSRYVVLQQLRVFPTCVSNLCLQIVFPTSLGDPDLVKPAQVVKAVHELHVQAAHVRLHLVGVDVKVIITPPYIFCMDNHR